MKNFLKKFAFVFILMLIPGFILIAANKNSKKIIDAIALYERGFHKLEIALHDRQISKIYNDDSDYLTNFPFSTYSIVNVEGQGKFYLDPISDSIKNQLRQNIRWEPTIQNLLKNYIVPGSVVVDIGAHIGTHALTMSEAVGKKGSVYVFEPNKKIFRELCMNLALNSCLNVLPIRAAIGKQKNIINIVASHPNNEGGSYALYDKNGNNTAAILPLDAFELSNVSLIKIDVENMESEVLDGAIQTIYNNKPILLVEIQSNQERAAQLSENMEERTQESINKIKNLGYELQHIHGADYLAFPKK